MSTPRIYNHKTYIEILEEGLQYIQDRRSGKVRSFKLPWDGINNVGVGGLEWGSMMTIGARPGAGKTMFVSQIIRESKILNPATDFNVLEFQFEMGAKQTASRDFAAQVGLDYNRILSTKESLDEFSLNQIKRYLEESKRLQKLGVERIQINQCLSASEMRDAIQKVYAHLGGKPLLITIDHSWLIKKDVVEKEKIQTLYNTVEMLMQLKNQLPIIVVMITQLNRSIDEAVRRLPGSIANYPTSSDIFGGDALMQGSDMVLILSRPYKSDIMLYGPKEYRVESNHVFAHIIKSRNNSDDNNLIFMDFNYAKQTAYEIAEPPCKSPSGVKFSSRWSTSTP